jgi:lipid II isoglutaminyl synthase (glutamine-hydrolysing)
MVVNASKQLVLRVCALYPDLMNIYADRGNMLMLRQRCAWRGIGFQQTDCGIGEPLDPAAHDLIYLGGGQDRDQLLVAEDLLDAKGEAIAAAAAAGVSILGVCGGYQLLGRSYELRDRERIEGLGLLDATTVREQGPRLIGNVAIEVDLDGTPDHRVLAGFENHGGRTRLGPDQAPLGKVLKGHGNDGRSGFEGARSRSVIGTYLHGPLLPKNHWFADSLIAGALGLDPRELPPLDDELERRAHLVARKAAGV